MFSYYGIAASVTVAIVNYIVLGFGFPVDGYYFHSWEIYLASVVVFFGSGTVGYTLLEYRLGKKQLVGGNPFFLRRPLLNFFSLYPVGVGTFGECDVDTVLVRLAFLKMDVCT
jgi:hypothetical protein